MSIEVRSVIKNDFILGITPPPDHLLSALFAPLAWDVQIHGCTLPEHTHMHTQTPCWAVIMVNCDCMIVQMDLL